MTPVATGRNFLQVAARTFPRQLVRSRAFAFFCLAAAVALFALSILGMIIPIRNPEIYHEPRNIFTNDITLTAEEFWKRVPRRADESTPDYARRMTETVADGIAHIQQADRRTMQKYRMEIPIWENYLIWASRHIVQAQRWVCGTLDKRGSAYRYQFSDYRRAVERGVGLCPTHAFIMKKILKAKGFHIQIAGIGRHTVTRAEVAPDTWWVLDPDFGVAIPYDLAALRENPRLIGPYYEARGHSKEWIGELEVWFADPNPIFIDTVREAQGSVRYYFEFASYYLIWIIPAVLLVTGGSCLRQTARKTATNPRSHAG